MKSKQANRLRQQTPKKGAIPYMTDKKLLLHI
jgi:hypothetical protein